MNFIVITLLLTKLLSILTKSLKKWKEEERNLGDMDRQWTEDKWEDGVIDLYDC